MRLDQRNARWLEGLAGGTLLAYGVVLDRALPRHTHVPANLAAGFGAVLLAEAIGVERADLGLGDGHARRGLRVGLATVGPIASSVAAGVSIPPARRFFVDRDAVGATPRRAWYEVLVRIPFGTALPEELLFRGALLGLLLRRGEPARAVAVGSVVFGLWHMAPTLRKLAGQAADGGSGAGGLAAAGTVAATVGVTTVAGVVLSRLRLRSGSVLAPWITHWAVNALAFLGARVAARRTAAARDRVAAAGSHLVE